MPIILENKQCIIAGDGQLPVVVAENAQKNGFEVVAISLASDNKRALKQFCSKVYTYGPGEIKKIKQTLKDEGITQVTFIGKVHKGLLLRCPKFDSEALELIKSAPRLNDDAVMLLVVEQMEALNIKVLDQTIFIKNLMSPTGVLGIHKPSDEQAEDVNYGFWLAKEMGKLDVGQSVVIKNKMIMAVEAIEGTDKCIKRGCRLGKKNVTVVKVSKPTQDKRFDIPAVGLETLKVMKRCGATLLALEAGETILINQKKVIDFANKNNIIVMAT